MSKGLVTLCGGQKGGTGKSTIATNMAVWFARAGADVVILDADPQGTANEFIGRRNELRKEDPNYPRIGMVQKRGDVYETATDLASRYDVVIIDAGGRDSPELRTAMMAADLFLTPIKASQADLETLPYVNSLVATARQMGNRSLNAAAFLSMAPANSMNREVHVARELLAVANIDQIVVADSIIRDRKPFRDGLAAGVGVVEMKDSQAKAEVQLLCQEFFNH